MVGGLSETEGLIILASDLLLLGYNYCAFLGVEIVWNRLLVPLSLIGAHQSSALGMLATFILRPVRRYYIAHRRLPPSELQSIVREHNLRSRLDILLKRS